MLAKGYLSANCSLTICLVCSALALARSSFYAARKAKIRKDYLDKNIFCQIEKIWKIFPGWGYRKLAAGLKRNGILVNGKKVLRILAEYRGIKTVKQTKKVNKERKYPNLIKKITKDLLEFPVKQKRGSWTLRDGKNKYRKIIEPTRPYQLWAGDWKELKVPLLGITIYIFLIIDCYSRQLKGWNISLIKDGRAAVEASKMAVGRSIKDPLFNPRNLIMHSDQGSAYLSEEYELYWKTLGVSLSTADRGKPTQNPYIEAFISILKRFWLDRHELITIVEIKKSLNKFFNLYNRSWLHGEIGFITPNQRLEQYRAYLKN